jgi:nicotinate-nucleotide adenylyltransferase
MIGIYGGTFDPVHFGHLRTALEVREALGLDEVRFTPCRQPPHRVAVASPEAREKMLELALAKEAGFVLDRRELDRPGPSYMIDTLAALRAEWGADASLCLILGRDAFLGLPSWRRWNELTGLAHLVVMTRPGAGPRWQEDNPAGELGNSSHPWDSTLGPCCARSNSLPESLCTLQAPAGDRTGVARNEPAANLNARVADDAERLRAAPYGLVYFQPVTSLDISASRIRALLSTGRSARYLLPDAVLDFIHSSGLYLPESPNPGESACIPSSNP